MDIYTGRDGRAKKGLEFKAEDGGQSYRQEPRGVVPVAKALKYPELHSLIDTVTHLGRLET